MTQMNVERAERAEPSRELVRGLGLFDSTTLVAGSMIEAVQTRNLWTFRRQISSRDPNWLLIETDEEE